MVMAKNKSIQKYKIYVGALVLALGFIGAVAPSNVAQAADCPSGRSGACNSDESRAINACNASSNKYVQGAIWFNNSSAAGNTDGYYALGVNIGATATSVQVNIRGSVYTCGQGAGDYDPNFAADIRSDTAGGAYPASSRLSIPAGSVLYRGNSQGVNNRFTSQGSAVNATLNVQGLATNNSNGADTQTITVGVYRCFSATGGRPFGGCSTSPVPVTITRAQAPVYNLNPSITINPTNSVELGQAVTATPQVTKAGTAAANNIAWQVTRFVVAPNGTVKPAAQGTADPRVYYGNGATTEGSGTQSFGNGTTTLADSTKIVDGALPVGTRICYALSIKPYNTNASQQNSWSHSTPDCVVVAKKPKVQVLGSDLIVGRASVYNPARISKVTTSVTGVTGLNYGSWSEYGVIPSGVVTGMASGAMFAGGTAANGACNISVLTFTNNTGTGCQAASVGKYTYNSAAPDVASRFKLTTGAAISGTSADLRNVASSRVYTVNSGTLNVNSTQPIAAGKWIVINDPAADITITSNIDYAATPLFGIGQIPQVVIIARNIRIADNVTNIDAWLIAAGTGNNGFINTCSSIPAGTPTTLDSTKCATKLTVNGPVQANKLYMYRTAGSGSGAAVGDPAEVFNLRADAYLWATSYSSGGGRLPTVSSKELPPRF
jgi:hypothetical protein